MLLFAMNSRFTLVLVLSLVAIVLYWFPVPLIVGDYILGGYPWIAPEASKTSMIILGVILSSAFLGLTGFMWYISKKLEEAGPQEEYEAPGEEQTITGSW